MGTRDGALDHGSSPFARTLSIRRSGWRDIELGEHCGKSSDLRDVYRRQRREAVRSAGRESDANDAAIGIVASTNHQAAGLRSVQQADDAVMSQHQRLGEITDARAF